MNSTITYNIIKNDNIDNLAFSFFSLLTFCSVLSDSYIVINNFLKSNEVKKKMNYLNKVFKVVVGLSFKKYKNDEEGNIIIDNENYENQKKYNNPFDDMEEISDMEDEKEESENDNEKRDELNVEQSSELNYELNNETENQIIEEEVLIKHEKEIIDNKVENLNTQNEQPIEETKKIIEEKDENNDNYQDDSIKNIEIPTKNSKSTKSKDKRSKNVEKFVDKPIIKEIIIKKSKKKN